MASKEQYLYVTPMGYGLDVMVESAPYGARNHLVTVLVISLRKGADKAYSVGDTLHNVRIADLSPIRIVLA